MNLICEIKNHQVQLTINRPEQRNAFDQSLIKELHDAFVKYANDDQVRSLLLTGKGEYFSSGADLHMMKNSVNHDFEQNQSDAMELALMIKALHDFPKPTIALVNGPAFGGAVGLISACDMVIAHQKSFVCLSEVMLGLIPAVISPFVIKAIGQRQAKRFFMGERISSTKAKEIGLFHEVFEPDECMAFLEKFNNHLKKIAPKAQQEAKNLVNDYQKNIDNDYLDNICLDRLAHKIAEIRTEKEAQDGIQSFFAKQNPPWNK